MSGHFVATSVVRILLWNWILVAPGAALACGGLFCSTGPGAAPVDQTGERILFEVEDDRVCATVDIRYTGNPEAFAWVVPVPETPEVHDGDGPGLRALAAATDLTWRLPPGDNAGCPGGTGTDCGAFCGGDKSSAVRGAGTVDDHPGVHVLERQQTDTYETVSIAAERADVLVAWLSENAFNVSMNMVPAMQPYLDEGMRFLAIKLRTDRDASAITPLRFCYRAAAPSIPLRLTAVAAQPRMNIEVFIVADRLYAPLGDAIGGPDARQLAFNSWEVAYPAWLARQAAHHDGRFWSVEYAGATPEVLAQDLPTGPACDPSERCPHNADCLWMGSGEDFRCTQPCRGDACAGEDVCFNEYCIPPPRRVALGPWLTRLSTRISPEDMRHDPVFVATPELPAFDGVVDLTHRGHVEQCGRVLEERAPSPCAFVYCGEGATCIVGSERPFSAACDCPADQVAVLTPLPGGRLNPTCAPRSNALGVLPEDGGTPCADFRCGDGECVPLGGFPSCRCRAGSFAFSVGNVLYCEPAEGEVARFAEGAGPDTGNRDDAPITTPDPRRPGLPAIALVALVAAGLLRRRRVVNQA